MSRGQDIEAQMHLSLNEAYVTHKQTFSINGENIRITVPAGVADGHVCLNEKKVYFPWSL